LKVVIRNEVNFNPSVCSPASFCIVASVAITK
jgi:hypothetical protein